MEFTLVIGPQVLRIEPEPDGELLEQLRELMSYSVPYYALEAARRKNPRLKWDGRVSLLRGRAGDRALPPGVYKRVEGFLNKFGRVHIRFDPDYAPQGPKDLENVSLDKDQRRAAKTIVERRFAIVESTVRSGKTVIAGAAIERIGHFPVLVLTTSNKEMVQQIKGSLSKSTGREVGRLSEGVFEEADVVVSHYGAFNAFCQEIGYNSKDGVTAELSAKVQERNERVLNFLQRVRVLVLDECHHAVTAKTRQNLNIMQSAGYRLGFSATPRPESTRQLEMEAVIGPVVTRIRFEQTIASGRVVQPRVFIYDLPASWYSYHLPTYEDSYEANIIQNAMRNQFIATAVQKLNEQNKSVFIMVSKLAHGETLLEMIPNSRYVHGGVKTAERQKLYEQLQQRQISCIIGTVGKEGLDLPALDAIINAEGHRGKITTIQKMRSLTAHSGKPFGFVLDFIDKSQWFVRQSMERQKLYEGCGGFDIRVVRVSPDIFATEGTRVQENDIQGSGGRE